MTGAEAVDELERTGYIVSIHQVRTDDMRGYEDHLRVTAKEPGKTAPPPIVAALTADKAAAIVYLKERSRRHDSLASALGLFADNDLQRKAATGSLMQRIRERRQ